MQTREIKILNSTFPSHNPSINYVLSYEASALRNNGQSLIANPDEQQFLNHYSSTTPPSNSLVHSPQFFLPFSSSCSWSLSNNNSNYSTKGEGHFQQGDLDEFERRCKRLQSNRESARRSRMRKQQQLDDLRAQVQQLEMMNNSLNDKFVNLLECNQQILRENAQLKEENCLYKKLFEGLSEVMNGNNSED